MMREMRFKLPILAALLLLLWVTACSDDDDPADMSPQDRITSDMTKGTWRITKFIDSDKDETDHFTGYDFTFAASGVLNANNGTNNYDGSWSMTTDSSDDDPENDLDFNINFNLTNDFEDLNDDWDIMSQTSSKLELMDDSGGNGDTDYLTFEKN